MRWRIFAPLCLAPALAAVACSSDSVEPGSNGGANAPQKFRIVILADSHVIGPQYECCSESDGVDNDSIVKTEQRLGEVRDKINALDPPPKMGFLLGDVVHDAYHSEDKAWYRTTKNAFSIAADILRGFDMPVHLVWGNHDYEVDCDGSGYPRELGHELFMDFFEQPKYQAIDYGGFKFLLTNGQLGPTWTPGDPMCDTGLASYGDEQLDWIAEQLEQKKPTFVLSHYMRLVTREKESESAAIPDLGYAIDNYENVEAFFVGHTHRWLDMSLFNASDAPHWVVAATRYDNDNFWVIELDGNTGEWTILDMDKVIVGNSCSKTLSYENDAMTVVEDAPETGDCVQGI